jgi:hypothetical protein
MATSISQPLPSLPCARFALNPMLLRAWTFHLRWKSLRHPFVIGALLGVALAVAFDQMMRRYEVVEWRKVLLGVGIVASWWPAWRAMVICLRHRQRETWVHWLMTPLTPRQLLHGLWLDAMAPALVMLAVAWPLMALTWHREAPILSWVLQGVIPDLGWGSAGQAIFFFGATLGLIALGSLTNTLLAVVIALRFRTVATMFTAMLVTLAGVLPALLAGLWWLWFQSGIEWVPRAPIQIMAHDYDWSNLARIALIYWIIKGTLCVAIHFVAVRRFQAWVLNDQ